MALLPLADSDPLKVDSEGQRDVSAMEDNLLDRSSDRKLRWNCIIPEFVIGLFEDSNTGFIPHNEKLVLNSALAELVIKRVAVVGIA